MNMNNISEAVNAFVSIYDYYQTDKSLSICYIPHLEKIFNDPNNYVSGSDTPYILKTKQEFEKPSITKRRVRNSAIHKQYLQDLKSF